MYSRALNIHKTNTKGPIPTRDKCDFICDFAEVASKVSFLLVFVLSTL